MATGSHTYVHVVYMCVCVFHYVLRELLFVWIVHVCESVIIAVIAGCSSWGGRDTSEDVWPQIPPPLCWTGQHSVCVWRH